MSLTKTLALTAAMGLALAPIAQAEDYGRDYDQVSTTRASEGSSVSLRFSVPLGGAAHEHAQEGPRLALRMADTSMSGDTRALDVVSYNFSAADDQQIQTPLTLGYQSGDGFWSKPQNWLLVGLGAAVVVWGVIELTDDDDDDGPPPPQ